MKRITIAIAIVFGMAAQDVDGQLFRNRARSVSRTFGKCGNAACRMCYPRARTVQRSGTRDVQRTTSRCRNLACRMCYPQTASSVASTLAQGSASVSGVCSTCQGCPQAASCASCQTPQVQQSAPSGTRTYGAVASAATAATNYDAFAPTSSAGLSALMQLCDQVLDMGPDDRFWDIGCGDGRILLAVHDRFACPCVGIERDEAKATEAFNAIRNRGLTKDISVLRTDATKHSALYAGVTVAYMYLPTETMEQVIPLLDRRTTLVSRMHPIPASLKIRQRKKEIGGETFYLVTQ